jgi:peptidoglycan/xylan/chitin deacetylase (PgdA/CDA1 family)
MAAAVAWWFFAGSSPESGRGIEPPLLYDRNELRVGSGSLVDDLPGGVAVLCYHYFRPGLDAERLLRVIGAVLLNLPTLPDIGFWTTTVPEFDRQMRWLADSGYRSLTLDELDECLAGNRPLPERSVVITIDDGDRSVLEHAVPVLRRHGMKATLFLLTGRVGERDWNGLDLVDWASLRRLEAEGILRVESHTHRMHTKVRRGGRAVPLFLTVARDGRGRVSADSPLGRDLRESRAAIRRHLGREPAYLAWPFGFGETEVDSLAHALGFRRIFTLRAHRNRPDFEDPFRTESDNGLGRYAVTARTSLRTFRNMLGETATR